MATNSSDAGNPPDPRPDGAQDALVESIYRIALEPQTYDSFMGQWDSYISARIEELNALRTAGDTSEATSNNPEIETHFRIAAQLLEQMGRPEPETARAQGNANPQMLVDTSGRIVWASTAATHLFGLSTSSGLDALALEEPQARALRDMAAGLRPALPDNAPDLPAPLLVNIRTVGPEVRVIYMVARVLPEQHGSDVLLISKIAPDWPAAMPRMLRDGFALSASEIEICELVAEGLTPAGIAQARASALATVRTQIKKIMAKTHCTSQAELVRLLHSVMRVADDGARVGTEPWSMADKVTSVLLPDRSMPVEHYGDPNGYPVVFFHGMLDGNISGRVAPAQPAPDLPRASVFWHRNRGGGACAHGTRTLWSGRGPDDPRHGFEKADPLGAYGGDSLCLWRCECVACGQCAGDFGSVGGRADCITCAVFPDVAAPAAGGLYRSVHAADPALCPAGGDPADGQQGRVGVYAIAL